MDPTRPIDPKKTLRPSPNGPKVAGGQGVASAAPNGGPGSATPGGSGVSLDVSDLGLSRAEIRRIDSQRLEALKDAIANDRYEVDADALARRIIEDALGLEANE